MPNIQIKSWRDGSILFEGQFASIREAVEAAVKSRANLCGANLACGQLREVDFSGAHLSCANLRYADFRNADFIGADIRGADIRGADFRGADIREAVIAYATLSNDFRIATLCFGGWPVTITPGQTSIGCQTHSNAEWLAWSPSDVQHMSMNAATWWADHGEAVKAVIRNVMQIESASRKVAATKPAKKSKKKRSSKSKRGVA